MIKEGLIEHHEKTLGFPEGRLEVEAVESDQDVEGLPQDPMTQDAFSPVAGGTTWKQNLLQRTADFARIDPVL